jgi:hypothetical protein
MHIPDGCVDDKVTSLLSESESCASLSSSGSTVSRFVGRLGVGMLSLSSLRTIPSWRSSLVPDAHATYAKIDPRCDNEGSGDSTDPLRHSHRMVSNQHPSSGNQRHSTLRRRHHEKRTRTPRVSHAAIPLLARFPHARTTTNRLNGPNRSFNSSTNTYQSAFDSHVPFPSTSEESYPSPHSPDAVAMFQTPLDKGPAPLFDCFVKRHDIPQDEIQVIFEESSDGTSTNASTNTGASPVRPASGRHDLLAPLRRRVTAVASSVIRTRRKFPTTFHKNWRPQNPVHDDDEPVEYDIPCLAYITCLW